MKKKNSHDFIWASLQLGWLKWINWKNLYNVVFKLNLKLLFVSSQAVKVFCQMLYRDMYSLLKQIQISVLRVKTFMGIENFLFFCKDKLIALKYLLSNSFIKLSANLRITTFSIFNSQRHNKVKSDKDDISKILSMYSY